MEHKITGIKPIKVKKRYVLAIEQILNLLKEKYYKLGDRLPSERVMSNRLGVSRASIREAYSALEIAGVLESRIGSGTYIKSEDIDPFYENKIKNISSKEHSTYEVLELRKVIEDMAVSLAVKNAVYEDILELENILIKMKSEMKPGKAYTLDTDALFHLLIAKSGGNAALFDVLFNVLKVYKGKLLNSVIEILEKSPGYLDKDIEFHSNMVKYIKNKDLKNARYVMRKHFDEIEKYILGN
jgi:GntR family transcriptional regulator, transcriptional repressor for pyruvate dehydrogenase complex